MPHVRGGPVQAQAVGHQCRRQRLVRRLQPVPGQVTPHLRDEPGERRVGQRPDVGRDRRPVVVPHPHPSQRHAIVTEQQRVEMRSYRHSRQRTGPAPSRTADLGVVAPESPASMTFVNRYNSKTDGGRRREAGLRVGG
ncbi:hypothetical protein ACIODS_23565 [Micromonospora chalcea]|uniref:hypothetical protein n=1 Tax=Micromonospora chalcea TaxID=1874 RepID=UPI0038188702